MGRLYMFPRFTLKISQTKPWQIYPRPGWFWGMDSNPGNSGFTTIWKREKNPRIQALGLSEHGAWWRHDLDQTKVPKVLRFSGTPFKDPWDPPRGRDP